MYFHCLNKFLGIFKLKSFVCFGTIFKDDSRLKSFKRCNPRLRNVFQTPDDWDTQMAQLEELSVNLKDSSKENKLRTLNLMKLRKLKMKKGSMVRVTSKEMETNLKVMTKM